MTSPQIVARLDERPRIVVRPDGSLLGLTVIADDAGWHLAARCPLCTVNAHATGY